MNSSSYCRFLVLTLAWQTSSWGSALSEVPKPIGVSGSLDMGWSDPSWRTDESLCGVNAAYVFLRLHNRQVDYSDLKRRLHRLHSRGDGVTLRDIDCAMQQDGLPTRVVRGDLRSVSEVPLPAVAHVVLDTPTRFAAGERGHYIVLLRFGTHDVRYIDGTTGRLRTDSIAQFFRTWSGYLLIAESTNTWLVPCGIATLGFVLCVASCWAWRRASQQNARRMWQSQSGH
jgi:hypothetical protein